MSILIKSTPNKSSIISYMFQESKVSSIHNISGFALGEWNYSENLYNEMNQIVKSISDSLPKLDSSLRESKSIPRKFKYMAENVISPNAEMEEDLRIWNDYYFEQIIDKIGINLHPEIIKRIKSALQEQNINYQNSLPVLIYTNNKGIIESIFIANEPADKYFEMDLTKLEPIEIGNKSNLPTKYLFMLN